MKYLAIAVGIPLVLALIAYVYFVTPSVYSVPSARGATIHCEVLHDYPSDVALVEITEATTGKVVWRVKAYGDKFQLHEFDLNRGWNVETLHPYFGQFQADIPKRGPFYLQPGTIYQASVCSSGWLPICRIARFTLL